MEVQNLLKMMPWQDLLNTKAEASVVFFFFKLFWMLALKEAAFYLTLIIHPLWDGHGFFQPLSLYFVPLKESSVLKLSCYINRSSLTFIQWSSSPISLKHMLAIFCDNFFCQDLSSTWFFLTASCFKPAIVCISDLAFLLRIIGRIPQTTYARAWSCILWYPMDENL